MNCLQIQTGITISKPPLVCLATLLDQRTEDKLTTPLMEPVSVHKMCAHVLRALQFLHSKTVTHKSLHLDCIWRSQLVEETFYLSDYSLRLVIVIFINTLWEKMYTFAASVYTHWQMNINAQMRM